MSEPEGAQAGGLDELLARIRLQMDLESEAEHDVLAEIQGHLEEAMAEARAEGVDEAAALARVAARFGTGEEVGQALQQTHAGWGTADAVIATALPVLGVLVLRWLIFPRQADGTLLTRPIILSQPVLWIVALIVLLVPLFQIKRPRYARVLWAIFWGLTVVLAVWPATS